MKFLHVSKKDGNGSHKAQSEYLAHACKERSIEYVRLIEGEIDPLTLTPAQETDIVYRSAVNVWGKSIEQLLIHGNCRHMYVDWKTAITGKGGSYHHFVRDDLPAIPSIAFLPTRKKDAQSYADAVGGFPLVIKVFGGMEGVGVIRVDSIEGFNSLSDFIRKDSMAEYRVMQYIPHTYYGRLVVVGDQVVAATRDMAPIGDFRANTRGPREKKGEAYKFSEDIEDISVRAAHSVGVNFAGVDILIGDDGVHYIAESNSPFNFAETQRVTGIDIAGRLLDFLIRKQ